MTKPLCSKSACDKVIYAKNLCRKHHYVATRDPMRCRRSNLRRWYKDEWPKRWDTYKNFLDDVGESPGSGYCLRKIDLSKPISKKNVHWVPPHPLRSKARPGARTGYTAEYNRFKKYGLYPEDYDRMLAEQGGVCAICKKLPARKAGPTKVAILVVDHDHETGEVRGLLCTGCNQGLGNFCEDMSALEGAITYLAARKK